MKGKEDLVRESLTISHLFFLLLFCFCCSGDYCLLSIPQRGYITGHSGKVVSQTGQIFVFDLCETSPPLSETFAFPSHHSHLLDRIEGEEEPTKNSVLCTDKSAVCQNVGDDEWLNCGLHRATLYTEEDEEQEEQVFSPDEVQLLYTGGGHGCGYSERVSLFILTCSDETHPPRVEEEEPCEYIFYLSSPLYCINHKKELGEEGCLFRVEDKWVDLALFQQKRFQYHHDQYIISFCSPLEGPTIPEPCQGSLLCVIEKKGRPKNFGSELSNTGERKIALTKGEECDNGRPSSAMIIIKCSPEEKLSRVTSFSFSCQILLLLESPFFCSPASLAVESRKYHVPHPYIPHRIWQEIYGKEWFDGGLALGKEEVEGLWGDNPNGQFLLIPRIPLYAKAVGTHEERDELLKTLVKKKLGIWEGEEKTVSPGAERKNEGVDDASLKEKNTKGGNKKGIGEETRGRGVHKLGEGAKMGKGDPEGKKQKGAGEGIGGRVIRKIGSKPMRWGTKMGDGVARTGRRPHKILT